MRRLPFAARLVLVVAPHPDDEVIAAWALMRSLIKGGARVVVIVVSDGAASHPGSRSWPPPRLARERRRETLRAMARLRIPPSRIRFLALPDGQLEAQQNLVAITIGRAVRRCPPPDLIVGPVSDDAHGDHRAVAQALACLPRRGERRLGYRVWPEGSNRSTRGVKVMLSGADLSAKRRAVRSYRTQAGKITDAEAGFTMTARHLRAFVQPVERFILLA